MQVQVAPSPVHAAPPPGQQTVSYAITAVVIVLVLALRLRGMKRERRLRLGALWVVPVVYALFAAVLFYEFPPVGLTWAVCAAALLVGAALGWQRGKLMHIAVDPATGTLNQRASPAALVFIVVLIAVRAGARSLLAGQGGHGPISALALTDVLVAFAVGLFAATRAEMYLRARRLLDEARGRAFS